MVRDPPASRHRSPQNRLLEDHPRFYPPPPHPPVHAHGHSPGHSSHGRGRGQGYGPGGGFDFSPRAYRYHDDRSRYAGSRYDGDRRSRSPRERSPYADRQDRATQYGDGDRRRPPAEARANAPNFQSNRDAFRDSPTGREPPRGPKALIEGTSGPRGGGFAGEFRGGRGGRGGGGRGRGWRDDSRDRGRDRELPDYRDRPYIRDERSRERDRDWRDNRERDTFPRGRRPSPPPGRVRSPPHARDFRDARDQPLGVDAERARRGSRDGPLSAGSSNSDPAFAAPSFRGGGGGGGGGSFRGGRGRGRGDWDRGRGRPGNFYDDRDRYGPPRSRSQEGRWVREAEERDRREPRYMEPARDGRDDRDLIRDREREPPRPKLDRVSHEPPPSTTKDVSPPPLAPSAPAFGTVPSRQATTTTTTATATTTTTTDIQSLTGKAPPTGPRALTEERPLSAGHSVGSERPPPTGPSKPALPDGSPPIPVGPRAQQKPQQRSSKQWINPALAGKKIPESPKTARSHSFVSQQSRPFNPRPESSHSDHRGEVEKRPRSPDARSESHLTSTDGYHRGFHISTPNDTAIKSERGTQSARASIDRDLKTIPKSHDAKVDDGDAPLQAPKQPAVARLGEQPPVVVAAKSAVVRQGEPHRTEQLTPAGPAETRRATLPILPSRMQLPSKQALAAAADLSSDSEEDEDLKDFFEQQISKTEAELNELEEDAAHHVPVDIVTRYATMLHEAMFQVATSTVGLSQLIGDIPDGFSFPRQKPAPEATGPTSSVPAVADEPRAQAESPREPSPIPTVENGDIVPTHDPEPQPKVEEMDTEVSGLPPLPTVERPAIQDEDVDMHDAAEMPEDLGPIHHSLPANGLSSVEGVNGLGLFPPPFPLAPSTRTSPSAADDDSEYRTEDDHSVYGSIEAVRQYSATPPIDDLPVFDVKPWTESKKDWGLTEQQLGFHTFLSGQIRQKEMTKAVEQEAARAKFGKDYDSYLRFTLSDDPAATKSREIFMGCTVPSTTNGKAAAQEPKPEGGRRAASRFSTELDLELAIQQSKKEEQEKREREIRAQQEKYRSEKEATIPDMYWTKEEREQRLFVDTSGLLPLEKLVSAWQVVPWHNNFTPEEAEKFEKAYLESPKQWGKIAKEIPNRDFRACIQYYYANKKTLNLKDKLKKQPRRRKKGRGKQRSSALVSELGNTENETEETQEIGENGERRRPRRAAAPTWGFEATPNADSDGNTPAATPGRRRAGTAAEPKNDSGAEKAEPKKPGRRTRQPKAEKEPKVPKPAQALAPTPAPAQAKGNRSRSNSRVQGSTEWLSPKTPADLVPRPPPPQQFDGPAGGMQPPLVAVQPAPMGAAESQPAPVISEVMAPPSLRPEPPPPPPPPASGPTFEVGQPVGPDRTRTSAQASSYWSVSEANDFPNLLKSFGTDWVAIANHMQTKTAVMVSSNALPTWQARLTYIPPSGQKLLWSSEGIWQTRVGCHRRRRRCQEAARREATGPANAITRPEKAI